MNSFSEPAALPKMIFHWVAFQGFCLKVSEDFSYSLLQSTSSYICSNSKKVVHSLFKIIQENVNNKINN